MNQSHEYAIFYMQQTMQLLQKKEGEEIPVASIVVSHNAIISSGINETRKTNDITSHAEIIALRRASESNGDWRLNEADLFVTMEPCMMCMGAIRLSRIRALYYGLSNQVTGIFSVYKHLSIQDFPEIQIHGGILENKIKERIQSFFQDKRR